MPSPIHCPDDHPLDQNCSDDLERDRLINRLLEQCLDLPDEERLSFLEANCDDPDLRDEVLDLLNEDLGDFLETPAPSLGQEQGDLGMVPLCYFGTLAIRRGDYDQAEVLLQKALKCRSPQDDSGLLTLAVVHRSLGQVYRSRKRFQDATDHYQSAVEALERCSPSSSRKQELGRTRFELSQAQNLDAGDVSTKSVLELLT